MSKNPIVVCLFVYVAIQSTESPAESLAFRLRTVDSQSNQVNSVAVGQAFQLQVTAEDIRDAPQGIFSAYTDVTFDAGRVNVDTDSLSFGPEFGDLPSGTFNAFGLLDEVGSLANGYSNIPPLPTPATGEQLLFTADFVATAPGVALFTTNAADLLPRHASSLLGVNGAVS
ncbi:MAG: hypothetical protein AAF497_08480, partial [Planctomycetota bacterium]